MPHLTLAHARQLSAALAPLYADPSAASLPSRLAEAVAGLLGAELAGFDFFDATGQPRHLNGSAPSLLAPELRRQLAQHVREHLTSQGIYVECRPLPLHISDYGAGGQLLRPAVFNDFYRAVTHQLIVGFDVPGQGFVTCALSRRRDFTQTERALLAFVQPHLSALFQLAARAEPVPTPLAPPQPAEVSGAADLAATLGLTLREATILAHVSQGEPDKLIAQRCCISPRTVQNHLHNIYAKLGVENRTAASRRALAV